MYHVQELKTNKGVDFVKLMAIRIVFNKICTILIVRKCGTINLWYIFKC